MQQVTQNPSRELPFKVAEDRYVNLEEVRNGSVNGNWQFVVADGVVVDENTKKLTKLTIAIAAIDVRDLEKRHYNVYLSSCGKIIYARSPIIPMFQLVDWEELYEKKDKETQSGHSAFARELQSYSYEERTSVIAFHLPDNAVATTAYFNHGSNPVQNQHGLYETRVQMEFVTSFIGNSNAQTMNGIAYVEFALSGSIVETKPVVGDSFLNEFQKKMNLRRRASASGTY